MKQRFWMSGLVLLMSLAICALSGCKKADDTGTGTDAGPSSGQAVAQMSDWPDDLPKFEGGKLFHANKDAKTGAFTGAIFAEIKDPESAFQQYKTTLVNKGWVFEEDTSNDVTWAAFFGQGSKNLHVSVSKDGLTASLVYLTD